MWARGDHLPDFIKMPFRLSILFPENRRIKGLGGQPRGPELFANRRVGVKQSCKVFARKREFHPWHLGIEFYLLPQK